MKCRNLWADKDLSHEDLELATIYLTHHGFPHIIKA